MSKPLRADRLGLTAGLQRLVDRAQLLATLDQRVAAFLPPSLAPHVRVANLRDGVLILHADSTAWRMRAHYLAPDLLKALRDVPELAGLTSIQVRVAPVASHLRPPSPKPLKLSAAASQYLAGVADTVSDPRLREALRRLAARGRQTS